MDQYEEEQQRIINAKMQHEMTELMGSCPVKTVIGVGAGAGLGLVFGLFMSSTENSMDEKFLKLSAKEQAKITLKQVGQKSMSSAKAFAAFSGVFVSSECITEAIRGKDDSYNALIAGCATGSILAHKGGLQAMALGCGGMALFQLAIDQYMHHTRHD
jgi:hypothetical protein